MQLDRGEYDHSDKIFRNDKGEQEPTEFILTVQMKTNKLLKVTVFHQG